MIYPNPFEDPALLLAAPFAPKEIRWKPQVTRQNRALAIPYITARCVMDRLDEVLGPDGWSDDYELVPNGVICRLSVRVHEVVIRKADAGSFSEQPDEGDKVKAAFSDALKRAAVKFGIGRYLYRLPAQWADYDPEKKEFTQIPKLPAWATPNTAHERFAERLRAARDTAELDRVAADIRRSPEVFPAYLPALRRLFANRLACFREDRRDGRPEGAGDSWEGDHVLGDLPEAV